MKETNRFSHINIPKDALVYVNENVLQIVKWGWDYKDCENFQKEAQQFIYQNKDLKIYIFCNHPNVFTIGRGNERGEDHLIPHDFNLKLDFPLHKIHRGGGITFHTQEQWIFYPIVALNKNYNLDNHICWMLKGVKEVLQQDFAINNVLATKKIVGVWKDKKKLASIGVGVNRFVTIHGLALNIKKCHAMSGALEKINPCGLNYNVYSSVNEYALCSVESFHNKWLARNFSYSCQSE